MESGADAHVGTALFHELADDLLALFAQRLTLELAGASGDDEELHIIQGSGLDRRGVHQFQFGLRRTGDEPGQALWTSSSIPED